MEEERIRAMDPKALSTQIDQFVRDFDLYEYEDTVENREQSRRDIQESIESGDTEYIRVFLTSIIENEEGTGLDQKKASDLLKALDEYKPLAKVEELEEQNYNMIDNRINNTETRDEKEKTKRPEGKYGHFRLCKRKEDKRFLMIADVQLKNGSILEDQVIGEFKDKAAAEDYCRQNNIIYEDITNYLQNRIDHKKKKIADQKSEPPGKPPNRLKDDSGLEEAP